MAQRSHRDIVVIGASSGGLEALKEIVAGLPADLPAAVFVVVHVPARGTSWLPEILSHAGRLPASHARHNEAIRAGRIYSRRRIFICYWAIAARMSCGDRKRTIIARRSILCFVPPRDSMARVQSASCCRARSMTEPRDCFQ